jgi:hypothetical protein
MTKQTYSYADRLRQAMEESAFFSSNGGQTRLAKIARCKSQAISQALSGASKELSAGAHARVCVALGIEALWLADGEGQKYRVHTQAQQTRGVYGLPRTEHVAMDVDAHERALLLQLRQVPTATAKAVYVVVDAMARAPLQDETPMPSPDL